MDKNTYLTMAKICERFKDKMAALGVEPGPRIDRLMDLEHAHKSVGLDLEGLLAAPDTDFIHDVAGITRHMDRRTGKLKDCFLPRYAKRVGKEVG